MKNSLTLLLSLFYFGGLAQSNTDLLPSISSQEDIISNQSNISLELYGIIAIVVLISLFIIFKLTRKPRNLIEEQTNAKQPNTQSKSNKTWATNINSNYNSKSYSSHKSPENKIEIIEPDIPNENNTYIPDQEIVNIPIPVAVVEQSSVKYIGYEPLNIFKQSNSFSYPYVVMPKPNSVIKFPRKGRTGRKGYTEDRFFSLLKNKFSSFQIYDNRHITLKNGIVRYEPDISMIDESNGRNMFINIEIDEPYEGTNDLSTRRVTHIIGDDHKRDHSFTCRGWIVIRFAEQQIQESPYSCLLHIADVIKSLNFDYQIDQFFSEVPELNKVNFWDSQTARSWSDIKYREQYLGIETFGNVANTLSLESLEETTIEKETEDKVDNDFTLPLSENNSPNLVKVNLAIGSGKFLVFDSGNSRTICSPVSLTSSNTFEAFCYIANKKQQFSINNTVLIKIVDDYAVYRRV